MILMFFVMLLALWLIGWFLAKAIVKKNHGERLGEREHGNP